MSDADRLRNDPEALDRLIEEHRVLKETVEHSPVLFCVYGPDETLLAWNPAYERNHPRAFADLRSRPAGARISYGDLVRHQIARDLPPDRVEDEVARRVALQNTADATPVERHYEASGWTQILKYRLPSGAVAGLALDINALKQREADLIEARLRAETAERVKASFLAKMSHEIRTPMNGVIGMAETLRDTALQPDQRLSVDTILTSAEALLTLINDILDFSRLEAGKMQLVQRPFRIVDEAESLCRLLAPRARTQGLSLILDVDPALEVPLLGDAHRVRQILTNLIGNAIKFTPSGHVLLRIDALPCPEAGQRCLGLCVQDTGIGIPADRQAGVFKAFEQIHAPGDQHAGGTGLGLAITAELVAAMGGTLSLTSDEGRGSRFDCRLNLPVALDPSAARLADPPGPLPGATPLPLHLIEPSPLHRQAALRLLRHMGFDPTAWNDLATFEQAAPPPGRVVLAHRALPIDPAGAAQRIASVAAAHGPCLVLWDRSAPPPGGTGARFLAEPAALRSWHAALLDPCRPDTPHPAPARPGRAPLSVLVAEDNRTNRLVLERMLSSRVGRLSFAENGRLALEQHVASPSDVILMDMAMPVMDGLDCARAIRAAEAARGLPRCTIVALTANAMASDRDACLAAGMDDFLSKPVRLADLLGKLGLSPPPGA